LQINFSVINLTQAVPIKRFLLHRLKIVLRNRNVSAADVPAMLSRLRVNTMPPPPIKW
jgi:hypothetical protein